MKSQIFIRAAVVLLAASLTNNASAQMGAGANSNTGKKVQYPETRKIEHVDDYHGTKVADPYRWLEDDNSAETKAWVEAQNKVTFAYLAGIPERKLIKDRLTKLWNYERYGVPFKQGGRYFFTKNNGLQNQSVLYTTESLAAEPRVLLDPNTLSTDGTVALTNYDISDDGKTMAYGLAASGSDWNEWRVRDVATGKDMPDVIKWVKFSGASFTKDGKGFFYSRYAEPKQKDMLSATVKFQKLYYHKLGTPQAEDQLIYERPDHDDWGFSGNVSDDGKYLVIHVWQGTEEKNRLYYKDLSTPDAKVVELLNDFDAQYRFIDNDGPIFWFATNLDAPRQKVIAIDTRDAKRANWKVVIPEAKETLDNISLINNTFIASYLKDARTQVRLHDVNGKLLRDLQLPGIGTVNGFNGNRMDEETFYSFTSYTTPTSIYRLDMKTNASSVFKQPKVDFNSAAYETKQVFYKSKDGTKVPMFITHKKGLKLNGANPTYLYGYGGFNIPQTPNFSVSSAVWMEMGGVLAIANLRGGGEYGAEWHKAGTKLRKQNVFDDFIAAGEYLVKQKYTNPKKLAVGGGSNGGLLVGAVVNQRPDLFGAALPAVGVMDMLRFHKFTIGWGWVSDYGSSDDPNEFKALYAYSPLHNLKPGTKYPAVMVTTADHDDRVVPAHSFKYAATLQQAQAGDRPVLIRIDVKAGHGAGKPVSKTIEEVSDRWGFLVRELGMKVPYSAQQSAKK